MQTPAPKFLPGFPVKIGYLGLYRSDENPTNRNGDPIKSRSTILGMRYLPRIEEDEDGKEVIMMPGWEYQVFMLTSKGYRDRGWFSEKELLETGYTPTEDDKIGGESELEMLRRLA